MLSITHPQRSQNQNSKPNSDHTKERQKDPAFRNLPKLSPAENAKLNFDFNRVMSIKDRAVADRLDEANSTFPYLAKCWRQLSNYFSTHFPGKDRDVAEDLFYNLFVTDFDYSQTSNPIIKKSCRDTILNSFSKLKELSSALDKPNFQIEFDEVTGKFALAINVLDTSAYTDDVAENMLVDEDDVQESELVNARNSETATTGNLLGWLQFNLFDSLAGNKIWNQIADCFDESNTIEAANIVNDLASTNSFAQGMPDFEKLLELAKPAAKQIFLAEMATFDLFDKPESASTWKKLTPSFSAATAPKAMKILNDISLATTFEEKLQILTTLSELAKPEGRQAIISEMTRIKFFDNWDSNPLWNTLSDHFDATCVPEAMSIINGMPLAKSPEEKIQVFEKLLALATPQQGQALIAKMGDFNFFGENWEAKGLWGKLHSHFDASNAAAAMRILNGISLKDTFEQRLVVFSKLAQLAKAGSQDQFKIAVKGARAEGSQHNPIEMINLTIEMDGTPGRGKTFTPQEAEKMLAKHIRPHQIRDNTEKSGATSEAKKLMAKWKLLEACRDMKPADVKAMLTFLTSDRGTLAEKLHMFNRFAKPEIRDQFKLELSNIEGTDRCQFNFKIGDFTVATIPASNEFTETVADILIAEMQESGRGFEGNIHVNDEMYFYTDPADGKLKLHMSDDLRIELPDNTASQLKKSTVAQYVSYIRANPGEKIDPDRLRMKNCDFRGMDFRGLDLTAACFEGCDLTGADFSGSNLNLASFSGANVTGANFTGAAGVDLQDDIGPENPHHDAVTEADYRENYRRALNESVLVPEKQRGGTVRYRS